MRALESFATKARARLRLPAESFSIALVTSAQIAHWNRAYRHKPRPTDVLSFPTLQESGSCVAAPPIKRRLDKRRVFSSASYLGDIAIAPAVARRNAARFGRAFTQEMQILILHGILHLLGYDHETDSGQMERYERRLRRELGLV